MDIVTDLKALRAEMHQLNKQLTLNNRKWLKINEACEYVGFSQPIFKRLVDDKLIRCHDFSKVGISAKRFDRSELDEDIRRLSR